MIVSLVFVYSLAFPKNAHAQVCYATRMINQWACIETTSCPPLNEVKFCRGDSSITCEDYYGPVDSCDTVYGNFGPCDILGCTGWTTAATCNQTGEFAVSCSAPPSCSWSGTLVTCYSSSDTCTPTNEILTYGCWGPGDTPTPTAGPTPTPGGPTPTPIVLCPNGGCDIEETCSSCPADCGVCPPATLTARAVTVGSDTSCTAVAASTDYLSGTAFSLSPKCIRRLAESP